MRRPALHLTISLASVVLAATLGVAPVAAQSVLVAPNVIVIDGRTRTTAITLVNNGAAPAEVTLGTSFGYPVSDSAGIMRLQTFTDIGDSLPSAAGFVHAYPSQFLLAPGARRVVRLLATPPASTADGEYWARLVVTTRAARLARNQADDGSEGDARVGLDLEIRSLLPLFYRQGAVSTGVAIDSLRASADADSVRVRVPMTRQGNAAFVGSVRAILRDANGAVVSTSLLPLGVYYGLDPQVALSRKGLRAGLYDLEVEATSRRPDVAAHHLTRTAPVSVHTPLYLTAARP